MQDIKCINFKTCKTDQSALFFFKELGAIFYFPTIAVVSKITLNVLLYYYYYYYYYYYTKNKKTFFLVTTCYNSLKKKPGFTYQKYVKIKVESWRLRIIICSVCEL